MSSSSPMMLLAAAAAVTTTAAAEAEEEFEEEPSSSINNNDDVAGTTSNHNKRQKTTTAPAAASAAAATEQRDGTATGLLSDRAERQQRRLRELLRLLPSSASQLQPQGGNEETTKQQEQEDTILLSVSKQDVEALVKEALLLQVDDDDESAERRRQVGGEQTMLLNAGLLSLQQVLLPLAASVHDEQLRFMQGKIKRMMKDAENDHHPADAPTANRVVQSCRVAVIDAIRSAMASAEASRHERIQKFRNELALEKQRKRDEHLQQKELAKKLRMIGRPKRLREAKKRHPHNVELYREQATLLSSLAQLDKELESWTVAEQQIQQQEAATTNDKNRPVVVGGSAETSLNNETNEDEGDSTKPSDVAHALAEELVHAQISMDRIRIATQVVDELVEKAEVTRSQLYRHYTQQVQFDQYKAPVRNPKQLLKELSQPSNALSQDSDGVNSSKASTETTAGAAPQSLLTATTNRMAHSTT